MTKIDEIRDKVELGEFCISNTQTTDFPGGYPDYDDKWDQNKFEKNLDIRVKSISDRDMEFDIVGIDCSIANSLRRIMLSEVPTMAIDHIEIFNNTSLVQDEVLAHRLGLIPITADSTLFTERGAVDPSGDNKHHSDDTVKFVLKAKCIVNPEASKEAIDPDELYINHTVKTDMMQWEPVGDQDHLFPNGMRPADEDIIIAKLRPGQEIHCNMYCYKGIGRTHAKFSPVATASYRIHPDIQLTRTVVGKQAQRLQECFPKGVIGIKEVDGEERAYVKNSRLDTSSREVLRHDDLRDCVKLMRIRNHFIFSIESTGCIPPEKIFLYAITVLQNKCKKLVSEIRNEDVEADEDEDEDMEKEE